MEPGRDRLKEMAAETGGIEKEVPVVKPQSTQVSEKLYATAGGEEEIRRYSEQEDWLRD